MGYLRDPSGLIADFCRSPAGAPLGLSPARIGIEPLQRAPHVPAPLRAGHGAVYIFALGREQGEGCEAGPGFVLKVGRAGPKSNAWFQSHHYDPGRANSTLAASLLRHPELWEMLGIEHVSAATVGSWMCRTLDRQHLFVPAADCPQVLPVLEGYLQQRLDPLFEGGARAM